MPKVVVIEDQSTQRALIHEILKGSRFEVHEAENGRRGLQVIDEVLPDVVVCDIFMPEMDGIETIRKLTKSRPGLPIIAMTSSGSTYLEIAKKLGAVAGLLKPFNKQHLLDSLDDALKTAS